MPAVVVVGTGAVVLPVPPVADVYQSKFVPVACNAAAVASWQYADGFVTAGAGVVAMVKFLFVPTSIGILQLSIKVFPSFPIFATNK